MLEDLRKVVSSAVNSAADTINEIGKTISEKAEEIKTTIFENTGSKEPSSEDSFERETDKKIGEIADKRTKNSNTNFSVYNPISGKYEILNELDAFSAETKKELLENIISGKSSCILTNKDSQIIEIKLDERGRLTKYTVNLDELGETESITHALGRGVPMDDELYEAINKAKHGERLDNAMADYRIQIGGKEVRIRTDNNLVSEDWAKENGIPEKGTVLTKDMEQAMKEALLRLNEKGQTLPEQIFYTDLFAKGIAGEYARQYPLSIFIKSNSPDVKDLKHKIYHETAHMQDEANRNYDHSWTSEENIKRYNIFPIGGDRRNKTISFNDKEINTNAISHIVSSYALVDAEEFIAEVAAMITAGTIYQKEDGNYEIDTTYDAKTDSYSYDFRGKKRLYKNYLQKDDLQNIMELYFYLTEGKIVNPDIK